MDINTEQKEKKIVKHKRWLASLLCATLGIFSVDSFYLGFIKFGILRIFINILLYIFIFLMVYYLTDYIYLVIYIPLIIIYSINIIGAFYIGFNKNYKDNNGETLI